MNKNNKNTQLEETKHGGKTKFYVLILLIGLVLTGWSLYGKDKGSWKLSFGDGFIETTKEEVEQIIEENVAEVMGVGDLAGILNYSSDSSRGNLKLVSKIGDIYIRTSRDFSALIGLSVLVKINGTLEKFELVDIQPKLEKDGYIISQ